MAQLDLIRSFAAPSLILVASALAACGGRMNDLPAGDDAGETDTGGDTKTDVPEDDGPKIVGFRSYTAKITNVSVKWHSGGPPGGGEVQPSQSWVGRMDLDAGLDRDGGASAMVMPPFGDAVALRGCCSGTVKMTAGAGVPFLVVSGTSGPYGTRQDSYDTLYVTFGSDGRAISARATGRTSYPFSYVGHTGDIEATIQLAPDATRPTFRTQSATSFASVSLPWDERVYEASEPYEGAMSAKDLLGPAFTAAVAPTFLVQKGWNGGGVRHRGLRFRLLEWDGATKWFAYTFGAPRDLAGNAAETKPTYFSNVVEVTKWPSNVVRFDAGLTPTTWGDAKVVSGVCKSAKSCLQIGPFTTSYCHHGSRGGFAVRMDGSGVTTATVRALAKLTSPYGGGEPPYNVAQLGVATPGKPIATSTDYVRFPAGSGSWDSGWVTLKQETAPGAIESGIALTAGGIGTPRVGCGPYGGGPAPAPAPINYEVTIFVEEISLSK